MPTPLQQGWAVSLLNCQVLLLPGNAPSGAGYMGVGGQMAQATWSLGKEGASPPQIVLFLKKKK